MSLHYLDGADWTAGETYSFELSSLAAQDVTELTMHINLDDQEGEIDLLPYLPYVNAEYGFTLTLPQSWLGQVDIVDTREGETDRTVVAFYMRNAFSGRLDGAGWLKKMTHITLPLLMDVSFICILMTLVWAINEFSLIWIMTSGGHNTTTLSILVYNQFKVLNINSASASAVMQLIITMVFAVLYVKFLNRED